jgi:glutathione S-transferase
MDEDEMTGPTYTLHYAPDNASLIIRLALLEAKLPFRTVLVDRASRAQDGPDYRRLNPTGLIPTLETPDGPLGETGAILLWLADRHGAGLGPGAADPSRGAFLQWLFFLSNSAHTDLRQMFYPHRYVAQADIPAYHKTLSHRMQHHFALLDSAAQRHPALFQPPSALTLYICALVRWSALYPKHAARWLDLSSFPHLAALAHEVERRDSVVKLRQAEGMAEHPFTNPCHPNPPEGSAL